MFWTVLLNISWFSLVILTVEINKIIVEILALIRDSLLPSCIEDED